MLIEIPALQTVKSSVEIKAPAFYKYKYGKTITLVTDKMTMLIRDLGITMWDRGNDFDYYAREIKEIIEDGSMELSWEEGMKRLTEVMNRIENFIPEVVEVS